MGTATLNNGVIAQVRSLPTARGPVDDVDPVVAVLVAEGLAIPVHWDTRCPVACRRMVECEMRRRHPELSDRDSFAARRLGTLSR